MSSPISPIRILPAEIDSSSAAESLGISEDGAGGSFGESLRGAMEEMGSLQGAAETKVADVLSGNGADVHSALIAVEKADLSFQLMMQVRNKIVSAYQEISRMQF
jgi:flagellar hook-basal body complex protein FliE